MLVVHIRRVIWEGIHSVSSLQSVNTMSDQAEFNIEMGDDELVMCVEKMEWSEEMDEVLDDELMLGCVEAEADELRQVLADLHEKIQELNEALPHDNNINNNDIMLNDMDLSGLFDLNSEDGDIVKMAMKEAGLLDLTSEFME